ncbi:MAG: SUMF1/EgtB/PvdO family nonheme iron enzyme, partial [Planctomycetota bacterium]|nr:SUMF1/EgtB/PvdO family nonheme iron enzyme [Planctomycetota bacterium]
MNVAARLFAITALVVSSALPGAAQGAESGLPARILLRQYIIELGRALDADNHAGALEVIGRIRGLKGVGIPRKIGYFEAFGLYKTGRYTEALAAVDEFLLTPDIGDDYLNEALELRIEMREKIARPETLRLILPSDVPLEFRLIPAGTFLMGSPASEARRDDDEVQHEVSLSKAFYMGIYEVTQAQWRAVMGNNPSYF